MYVATVVFAIVTALIVYMSLRVIGIGEAQLEVIKSYQLAYKPQYTKVYTHRDIVEMMANSCKIPYIFLDSSDVGDYHAYDFKSQCSKKKDELLVIQHMNGQIQLQDTANEFLGTEDFDCYYQKMGDEGTLTELTMFTNYTIPFARFEVICKNYDNIIYRKPFQNLALIIGDEEEPWENNTCSITTLHIPRMSYKIFSRTFTESNTFMKRNFLFFKLLFSGEQLGMETEDQANFKLRRFATENGYRVYENSDFAEYFDFLKENYKENVTDWEVEGCFEDGTKLADQELNLFLRFNAMAKNMKTFSNFYISPYGPRRNIIDENLKKTLQRFFLNRLGKRTTVIVKSFNPYPTDDEDEVNPTFAIRYCDEIRLKLGAKRHIVLANTERLMTTERMDNLVESLIDPSIPSPTNELYPVNSTCELLNNINCFCMKQLNKTTFEGSAQDKFIEKAWKDFEQIVESIGCFGEVEKSDVQFYHYHSHVKGEFYLAEFKAQITSSTNSTRTYEGQRSWKFYQNFQGAHGYGTIRLRMSDDSTTIIDKKFC